MFITTQDIVNFRNPTAEVLPVEKDFNDKSKYTVKINLMDLNFCSPTMSSFDPCLAEICKLKLNDICQQWFFNDSVAFVKGAIDVSEDTQNTPTPEPSPELTRAIVGERSSV